MVTAEDLSRITFAECRTFIPNFRTCKCVKVYDGQICHMGAYMDGYGATRFTCRLVGIDTPELRAKSRAEKILAKVAREEVKSIMLNRVLSVTINGNDKYGRLLLRVRTDEVDDVSKHLIDAGLAVAYDGGRKSSVNWGNMLKDWMHRTNAIRCGLAPQDACDEEDEDDDGDDGT